MVLPTPPVRIPMLPRGHVLADVEYYERAEPPVTLTPYEIEWLWSAAGELVPQTLVHLARQQQQNKLLRKWWYDRSVRLNRVEAPEDKRFVRDKLHTKRYSNIFWTQVHCRLCGVKLWSGITLLGRPPKTMPEVLRKHAQTHLHDCMTFIKKEVIDVIRTVRRNQ